MLAILIPAAWLVLAAFVLTLCRSAAQADRCGQARAKRHQGGLNAERASHDPRHRDPSVARNSGYIDFAPARSASTGIFIIAAGS